MHTGVGGRVTRRKVPQGHRDGVVGRRHYQEVTGDRKGQDSLSSQHVEKAFSWVVVLGWRCVLLRISKPPNVFSDPPCPRKASARHRARRTCRVVTGNPPVSGGALLAGRGACEKLVPTQPAPPCTFWKQQAWACCRGCCPHSLQTRYSSESSWLRGSESELELTWKKGSESR